LQKVLPKVSRKFWQSFISSKFQQNRGIGRNTAYASVSWITAAATQQFFPVKFDYGYSSGADKINNVPKHIYPHEY